MRKTLGIVVALVALPLAADAEGLLQAEGVSGGSTVIRFHGSQIETTFDGTQEFRGTLTLGIADYPFVAFGTAYGAGVADANTFDNSLWVLFHATGTLDGEDPISIRGGMDVRGEKIDLDSLSIGGGAGTFFLIVEVQTTSYEFSGAVESTATGSLVPPEDPLTMQATGTATSLFEGALREPNGALADRLPWDVASWPAELHEQLMTLLVTGVMPERAVEEPEADPESKRWLEPPPP